LQRRRAWTKLSVTNVVKINAKREVQNKCDKRVTSPKTPKPLEIIALIMLGAQPVNLGVCE